MRSAARWAALAAPPAASTLCSRCGRPGGLHRTGWLRAVLVLLSHGPLTSTPQELLPAGIRTCYGISVRVFSCRALFAFAADQPRRRGEPRAVLPTGAQAGACCFFTSQRLQG